jgi:hypothetical protein
VALLQTMEQICKEHLPDVDGDMVLQLIEFSIGEMTQSTDYEPDLQLPASSILVALGQAHCNEVCAFSCSLISEYSGGSTLESVLI